MSTQPTVLLIEDDPVFRRVLQFTVANKGLRSETANDGDSGYARLIQGGIDFIVTDYQMPGCDGVELLRRLDARKDYTRPAAILCTAKGLEIDSEQLRNEFRLNAIMHKPFSPRGLGDMIVRHLEDAGRITRENTTDAVWERHDEPSVRRSNVGNHRGAATRSYPWDATISHSTMSPTDGSESGSTPLT